MFLFQYTTTLMQAILTLQMIAAVISCNMKFQDKIINTKQHKIQLLHLRGKFNLLFDAKRLLMAH